MTTIVAAGLVVGAVACGGGDQPDVLVATTQVSMPPSYRFDPRTIEVDAGAVVTWTNDDHFTHTVELEDMPDREVGKGETVSIAFPNPGTYHYVCTLHPHDMQGEVVVR
ncbi:MAG TPA: plastocyanin/azurin family copper-binding protein [Gaiellaceae bacterium]|nr:plastocyanin/azurin family copper-binding protein [Gaiellaceae bacterium]